MICSTGFRIDPAPQGIHIIDVENGGERVFISNDSIDDLIKKLEVVKNDYGSGKEK